jgi:hypothetical protein
LFFLALSFGSRLVAQVPKQPVNLTRYHGVFTRLGKVLKDRSWPNPEA